MPLPLVDRKLHLIMGDRRLSDRTKQRVKFATRVNRMEFKEKVLKEAQLELKEANEKRVVQRIKDYHSNR